VKVDLIGGLALFGRGDAAALGGARHPVPGRYGGEDARAPSSGVISAVLFLGDGLFGGNRLGKGTGAISAL
jgi:hypothetical protein